MEVRCGRRAPPERMRWGHGSGAGSEAVADRKGRNLAVALACTGGALTGLFLVAGAVLLAIDEAAMSEHGVAVFIWPLPYLALGTVGTVIAVRRPRNPIGWLFLLAAASMALTAATSAYAAHAYNAGTPLPGAAAASWVSVWAWAPSMSLLPVIFMLFPTGKPISARWRWPIGLALANAAAIPLAAAPLWSHRGPILLEKGLVDWPLTDLLANRMGPGLLVVGLVSIAVRFRRSSGDERQQMKWLVLSASILGFLVLSLFFVPLERPNDHLWVNLVLVAGVSAIPFGAGVAILKYRLYEIDRLVNRTVVYGLVTSVLALIYVTSVVLLQSLLRPLTRTSDLAVAASTLAVAAAFRPVRYRVQVLVDRRFNRARYDAQQVVASFAGRLRDEIDLDTLRSELLLVVRRAVQPRGASVWVPPPAVRR